MRWLPTTAACQPDQVRSTWAFLGVAAAVTLSPGPAFALMLQVAVRDGWHTAMANILGNAVGVLMWGALSAVGVAALIRADRVAYDVLHIGGALFLVWLGVRALVGRSDSAATPTTSSAQRAPHQAFRKGVLNSVANPKLAVFFVSLFPQFVARDHPLLPTALAMAGVIITFDLLWYGAVAFAVDRGRRVVGARLRRWFERVTGAALLGFGTTLITESR